MSKRRPKVTSPQPPNRWLMWLVVATAGVVMVLLLWLARSILAELDALGGQGGAASTRLLTGLFVVMCLAGFTAAALWAAFKRAIGRVSVGK